MNLILDALGFFREINTIGGSTQYIEMQTHPHVVGIWPKPLIIVIKFTESKLNSRHIAELLGYFAVLAGSLGCCVE